MRGQGQCRLLSLSCESTPTGPPRSLRAFCPTVNKTSLDLSESPHCSGLLSPSRGVRLVPPLLFRSFFALPRDCDSPLLVPRCSFRSCLCLTRLSLCLSCLISSPSSCSAPPRRELNERYLHLRQGLWLHGRLRWRRWRRSSGLHALRWEDNEVKPVSRVEAKPEMLNLWHAELL